MERYKDTEYFITRNGDVYRRGRKLKYHLSNGYCRLQICCNGVVYKKTLHRLVAETYIPNPNNLPQVNHLNGDKLDNRVENLEWCSSQHNTLHRSRVLKKQIGTQHHSSKLTEQQVREIRETYIKGSKEYGIRPLSRKYGVDRKTLKHVISGITWKHLIDEPVE